MDAIRQGIAGCLSQATDSKTVGRKRSTPRLFLLSALLALVSSVPWAQEITPDETLRRQQERERALQERQIPDPDVRLSVPVEAPGRLPEGETPCFVIEQLELQGAGAERFAWVLQATDGGELDDSPIGRCLGTQGINLVLWRAPSWRIVMASLTAWRK